MRFFDNFIYCTFIQNIFMRTLLILLCLLIQVSVFAQFEENVVKVGNWQDPDAQLIFPGNLDVKYHDIWGVEVNGREYAITSGREGTHIIDIQDTSNLELLYTIPAAHQGADALHRDYHDYNGYLYVVCDEGPSTLQIIDISNLPEEPNLVYDINTLFTRAHNVFIDTANAKLYAAGANTANVLVASLENPKEPTLLYEYNEGYVHDLYVRDNIGYLNHAGQGLYIVEFGNEDYTVLGTLTEYPDKGYNHSGWLSEDGKYYALCDETHGTKVKLLDVSDPTDIKFLSLFGSDVTGSSIPHNVLIRDHYAFVSYYYDGLQIFDISEPEEVVRVGQYDTYLAVNDTSYKGAWGVYPHLKSEKVLVSDMQTGLYVFDVDLTPVADFDVHSNGDSIVALVDKSRWKPTEWAWTINGDSTTIISTDANPTYALGETEITEICLTVTNAKGEDILCEDFRIVNTANYFLQNEINYNIANNNISINYLLKENKPITYSLINIEGKVIYKNTLNENAGNINHKIELPKTNKLLILSLQSGNSVWSEKLVNFN